MYTIDLIRSMMYTLKAHSWIVQLGLRILALAETPLKIFLNKKYNLDRNKYGITAARQNFESNVVFYVKYRWFYKKVNFSVHSFNDDYLSLSAQVAKSTFFMKSQVPRSIQIKFTLSLQCQIRKLFYSASQFVIPSRLYLKLFTFTLINRFCSKCNQFLYIVLEGTGGGVLASTPWVFPFFKIFI